MSVEGHIAVYGGSFNPPHMGHLMACLYLLEGLGAGAVWLVPAWVHPFGKALAPFEHRLEMCERIARGLGPRVVASAVERELAGTGRTYDTLCHLLRQNPGERFALAVGSDILAETGQWHRWEDISSLVPLAVMRRGGYPLPESTGSLLELPEVSSSEVRRRLRGGESVEGLLPQSVIAYIAERRLYSE